MGLMAMGATFDFRKALGKIKPAVTATIMKHTEVKNQWRKET